MSFERYSDYIERGELSPQDYRRVLFDQVKDRPVSGENLSLAISNLESLGIGYEGDFISEENPRFMRWTNDPNHLYPTEIRAIGICEKLLADKCLKFQPEEIRIAQLDLRNLQPNNFDVKKILEEKFFDKTCKVFLSPDELVEELISTTMGSGDYYSIGSFIVDKTTSIPKHDTPLDLQELSDQLLAEAIKEKASLLIYEF